MTENEVVKLMWSSRNDQEWTKNQERVEAAHGGLPGFWYDAVVRSKLQAEVLHRNAQVLGAVGGERADRREVPERKNEVLTESGVVALMRSSKDSREWAANCDRVKASLGGRYPAFWYAAIIRSGLMNEVLGPGADEITIKVQRGHS